ncbi:MAG: hypothetical protein NTX87_02290 [Planctomycetota bacterium]|jgi:hypothetical protein|nr:hypothetical protein [Planctomycetota bacterium]
MTASRATAEVFVTALRALPRKQRDEVLARIASDPDLREDLLDRALLLERRREPSRPLRDYLAERRR